MKDRFENNDLVRQTRSVINELRSNGISSDASIMSVLILLFIINEGKKYYKNPNFLIKNNGADLFNFHGWNLLSDIGKDFQDEMQSYLRRVKPYKEIIFEYDLVKLFFNRTESQHERLASHLIDELTNISRAGFADISNNEINRILSKSINIEHQFVSILDPCIGSAKLIIDLYKNGILDPERVNVHGIEINRTTALLAHINLSIHNFQSFHIDNMDVMNYEFGSKSYDLVISDLPLGISYKEKSKELKHIPVQSRFYYSLIKKCIKSLNDDGSVYLTANSQLIRKIRRLKFKDQNLPQFNGIIDISEVAKWSYTSSEPYILRFNKDENSEVCIGKYTKENDYRFDLRTIDRIEFDYFNQVEDPSFFLSQSFQKIHDAGIKNFTKLSKYFELKKKERITSDPEDESYFKIVSGFVSEVQGFGEIRDENLTEEDVNKLNRPYIIAKYGDWVLALNQNVIKILICKVEEVILPYTYVALKPKKRFSKKEVDWLLAQLRNDFFQTQLKSTVSNIGPRILGPTLNLNKLFLDNHTKEEKDFFIAKWKEKRIEQLQKEKKAVQSKYSDVIEKKREEEFELVHDLHHSLKNELSKLTGATKSIELYLRKKEQEKSSISLGEPIRDIREGADPKLHKTVRDRLDTLISSSQEMTKYLDDYKSILKFDPKRQNPEWINLKKYISEVFSEYSGFSFEVIEKEDQLENNKGPFYLYCDKSVLRLVLTNVISNAIKYSFVEDNIQYSFLIELDEVQLEKEELLKSFPNLDLPENYLRIRIKNDGAPLPEKVDRKDFFKKGFSFGPQKGSGLGTYHIKKGIESIGGMISLIEPKQEEVFQFQYMFIFPHPIFKMKSELSEQNL